MIQEVHNLRCNYYNINKGLMNPNDYVLHERQLSYMCCLQPENGTLLYL